MTTIDELSELVHQQIQEGRERRTADEVWRKEFESKFENRFRLTTEEIERVSDRVRRYVEKQKEIISTVEESHGFARKALTSQTDLEEKVFVDLMNINQKLQNQDIEISNIKTLNVEQTKTLTAMSKTLVQFEAGIAFIKWIIPGTAVL